MRFDALACSVSRSTPVGADSVAVKPRDLNTAESSGLSRRSGSERVLRAGCEQPAGPWRSLVPLVLIAHRSVYNQSKALYTTLSAQNARCTWPRWEAAHGSRLERALDHAQKEQSLRRVVHAHSAQQGNNPRAGTAGKVAAA